MSSPLVPFLGPLETNRLLLRPQNITDAAVLRQLWTERDPRVPDHRRIDPAGRPRVEDIAARLGELCEGPGPRLLTVQRKDTSLVIGYCGLITTGNGSAEEPELAYELCQASHGNGYATEAGHAVTAWADKAGYHRLWAGVWDWNVASRRVLRKLGFHETGTVEPASPHGQTLLTLRKA